MKTLKKIGIVLLAIVAVVVCTSYLLPSTSHVERSHVMKAPVAVIYDQVNTLKNWKAWSPWYRMEPTAKMEYGNLPSGAGAWYAWSGEKTGSGRMTVVHAQPDSVVNFEMEFTGQGKAYAGFIFTPEGNNTKVTWTFKSEPTLNPVARWFGFLAMEKLLAPDYEAGLVNLEKVSDSVAKAKPPAPEIIISSMEIDEQPVLTVRSTIPVTEITNTLIKSFGMVGAYIKKHNLKQAGPVFAIYHSYNESGTTDMEAGVPIDKADKGSGEVKGSKIEKGEVAVADYYGPYEGTKKAHEMVTTWIKERNRAVKGSPWESYVTDPMTEKDSNKWLTKVYYPLKK